MAVWDSKITLGLFKKQGSNDIDTSYIPVAKALEIAGNKESLTNSFHLKDHLKPNSPSLCLSLNTWLQSWQVYIYSTSDIKYARGFLSGNQFSNSEYYLGTQWFRSVLTLS
jgi:hypothetical protein